jgi:AcrR family transcriptional regulator
MSTVWFRLCRMPYDPDATRARIFAAAVDEFAQHGIAGARVDRIAKAAKANKQAIYLYFGDKERLFAAVLQSRLDDLASAISIDPQRVPDYIGELFDYVTEHPDLVRLLVWEAMEHDADAELAGDESRRDHYAGKVRLLEAGQRASAIDNSLNARRLLVTLIGLVHWYVIAPQVNRMILGDDAKDHAAEREFLVEAARRLVNRP